MNLQNRCKVLIIGGAGYVGSVLSRHLLLSGFQIRILDALLYQNGQAVSALAENPDVEFVHGSFGDLNLLRSALAGVTDVVLLAAMAGDHFCKKYPELARNVNLEYPKFLFRVMQDFPIRKFIFTSTCSNYGLRVDDTPARETDALNAESLYAETKIAYEEYILRNLDGINFCPTILRISTAFGISSHMRFYLTISTFSRELALGRELLVFDENAWKPYCHVSGISEVILRVLNAKPELVYEEVFNTGGDKNNYTKKQIVDLICKHIPEAKTVYQSGVTDPRNYRVSFEKIQKVLNFEPDCDAESSIKQVIHSVHQGLFDDYELRKNYYGNHELIGHA